MLPVLSVQTVQDLGIDGDTRYFNRRRRSSGLPSHRQISLMEREQIQAHARTLGIPDILPGTVRANIETTGIDLSTWIGRRIHIGESILLVVEARTPCARMDSISPGLRKLMESGRQGVLAQVVQSGTITVGDTIRILPD